MRKISKAVLNPPSGDHLDSRPRGIPGAMITSWNGTLDINFGELFAKPANGPTVAGSTAVTPASQPPAKPSDEAEITFATVGQLQTIAIV